MKQKRTITDSQVNDFITEFCPFGYMDCKAAVETAYEAGFDSQWAADQVQEFCESTGSKIGDVDPCYCVYNSILQGARNEIDNLTSFDIQNDASFDTYGNFMCTSYDYNEESKQSLLEKLAENDVNIEDLEEATQYFLSQVEVSQEDIDNVKKQIAK